MATWVCTDGSYANVAAKATVALNPSLAHGDTVTIPADSKTWTTPLLITKAITLAGAGSGLTLVNATTNTGSAPNAISVILGVDQLVRITGIGFTGQSGSECVSIYGNVGGSTTPLTNLRIDHCTFTNASRAVCTHGWVYGVIDNCDFTNNIIAVGPYGDDAPSWSRAIQPGSANALFVETCNIVVNASGNANAAFQFQSEQGARLVVRYCVIDTHLYTADQAYLWDSHGKLNGAHAQPIMEMYQNTISVHHSALLMDTRGGVLVFHDNAITSVATVDRVMGLRQEDQSGSYPMSEQITQNFFYLNTLNLVALTGGPSSAAYTVQPYEASADTYIQVNRDFYMRAMQSGDTYFPYTPYTYPHPLRGSPTVSSATIDSAGTSLTVALSASCTTGAGGAGGVKITILGIDYTGTYASGSGSSSYVFTIPKVYLGAAVTFTYTQPANGIESTADGTDLASVSAMSVTNNSTQVLAAVGGRRPGFLFF